MDVSGKHKSIFISTAENICLYLTQCEIGIYFLRVCECEKYNLFMFFQITHYVEVVPLGAEFGWGLFLCPFFSCHHLTQWNPFTSWVPSSLRTSSGCRTFVVSQGSLSRRSIYCDSWRSQWWCTSTLPSLSPSTPPPPPSGTLLRLPGTRAYCSISSVSWEGACLQSAIIFQFSVMPTPCKIRQRNTK